MADSFVVRGRSDAESWVGSYFCAAPTIRERLESFVIADDVVVEDRTAEWRAVTLLPASAQIADTEVGFRFPGRRGGEEQIEWILPMAEAEPVEASIAGLAAMDAEQMERRRIRAGIPAVPRDIGRGDLPNEGGLEADAISFTKGCYLGQEVMARLKSMGQVRRRLRRVVASEAAPGVLPAPFFIGDRQVGELRSAVADGRGGAVGLAMVSLMHVAHGAALSLTPRSTPTWRLAEES